MDHLRQVDITYCLRISVNPYLYTLKVFKGTGKVLVCSQAASDALLLLLVKEAILTFSHCPAALHALHHGRPPPAQVAASAAMRATLAGVPQLPPSALRLNPGPDTTGFLSSSGSRDSGATGMLFAAD